MPETGASGAAADFEHVIRPSQSLLRSHDAALMSCSPSEPITLQATSSNRDSPSARFYNTSSQFRVTTALDWLGASGSSAFSFTYFLEEVDVPAVSSIDSSNFMTIKSHITKLAIQDQLIGRGVLAAQGLYRAQVNRLSMVHAISEYEALISAFEEMVADNMVDFDNILSMAFLLCICEVSLPNEDGPASRMFSQSFETRLATWLLSADRLPTSMRIASWLQILHVVTKRSGCAGLLPESMFELLGNYMADVPSLAPLDDTDSTTAMYDVISAPIFLFYLKLLKISNRIQDLSHYRRSRITPEDQEEVTGIVGTLKDALSRLWDARPPPLRFQPNQLRQHFSPAIAEPLTTVAGVCIVAYFGEVVGLRRTLGDNPFPSPESEQAMRQIRATVEPECNSPTNAPLSPGFIRPLFFYAIETLREDETQWAVDCIKQVQSPTSRSEFIASLAQSLAKAQRTEQRRVATKYFCMSVFTVMVPRM